MSRSATAAVVVCLTSALNLTGCSSSRGKAKVPDSKASGRASVTQAICAKTAAGKKIAVPAAFPAAFPLPPGTVVYSAVDRGKDVGIVVTGVTSAPFRSVLRALQTQLPARGFTPKDGEVEPRDAESDWTSAAYTGRWAIRQIPQCNGDTLVTVLAHKTG